MVFLLVRWARGGASPFATTEWILEPWFASSPIPIDRAAVALLAIWYAFLAQLTFRWAAWLPFYCVLGPVWWSCKIAWRLLVLFLTVLGNSAAIAARPLLRRLEWITEEEPKTVLPVPKQRSWPVKRLWFLIAVIWFIAFRTVDIWWAAWLGPLLAIPIWLFFLRKAYALAVEPKTFVMWIASSCARVLDRRLKAVTDARDKKGKVESAGPVYRIIDRLLMRYPKGTLESAVLRETLAMFSAALALALIASAGFWALVGIAIQRTDPTALSAYSFFRTGGFVEFMIWAWGCMTTALAIPGHSAPVWLKGIHVLIMASGLFQITFLLACFSIMTSAESEQTAARAQRLLDEAVEKLAQTRALEAVVIVTETVPAAPSPERSDAVPTSATTDPATEGTSALGPGPSGSIAE